jgi:pimeloyl-ACP methyl ester carboxylesterase
MQFLCPEPFNPNLPALIYLPGMDGTGQLFHRQSSTLARFFNIYCLSLPTKDKSTWQSLSQNIWDLCHKVIGDRPIHLCGESFGGCLALQLALNASKSVEQLILINPASSFSRYPWLSWGVSLTRSLPMAWHSTTTLGFLPFLAALDRIEAGDRRQLLQSMRSVSPDVISWRLGLLQNFALAPQAIQNFESPTLILASRNDRLLPSVTEGQRLQSLFPRAKLQVLPYSGHACLLEKDLSLTEIFDQQGFLPLS